MPWIEKVSEDVIQRAIALYQACGNKTQAAKEAGIHRHTLIKYLKIYGVPENPERPEQTPRGYSTLYKIDETGNRTVVMEWEKTEVDKEKRLKAICDSALNLANSIDREPPDFTDLKEINADLLTCYVLTDYHLGQLSWGEETGEDWDVDIAYSLAKRWFASAVNQAPASEIGVLAQLGDFLHWDGLLPVTPTSGHVLDADTRFAKMVDLGIKTLRIIIKTMLKKHRFVHVILAEGNHDIMSSVWLRSMFTALFENEPRVTVDNTHLPYYCYEWGETSLFFHHGHKKKLSALPELFASQFRDIYGRTKYSYGHTGHLHHVDVKENGIMIMEQHPTLAARDAHSARSGYNSKRAANVITYSKNFGEVSRITIRPEMVF